MSHYILYAAAWLFMSGFVYEKGDDTAFDWLICLVIGPLFFPWVLGQAVCAFLTKK